MLTRPGSRTFWARGGSRRSNSINWGISDDAGKIRLTLFNKQFETILSNICNLGRCSKLQKKKTWPAWGSPGSEILCQISISQYQESVNAEIKKRREESNRKDKLEVNSNFFSYITSLQYFDVGDIRMMLWFCYHSVMFNQDELRGLLEEVDKLTTGVSKVDNNCVNQTVWFNVDWLYCLAPICILI